MWYINQEHISLDSKEKKVYTSHQFYSAISNYATTNGVKHGYFKIKIYDNIDEDLTIISDPIIINNGIEGGNV